MSYFGKKSLIWWDYEDHSKHNALRYIHSELSLQYKVLSKWYPRGLLFTKFNDDRVYRIVDYIENQSCWFIVYEPTEQTDKLVHKLNNFNNTANPVLINPLSESILPLKRGSKLDRILKSTKNPDDKIN